MELIRLEGAVIGYRTPLLPPLDLAVRAGSTLGVLGPNGAGKTALLKSLLGLLPLLGGKRVLPLGRTPRVGYVPQRDRLEMSWPLRVLDVVLMGRARLIGPVKRYSAKDKDAARAMSTFWCWPPESAKSGRSARSPTPISLNAARAASLSLAE